jgi:endonuclease YncB( thermonuclease family)
MRNAVFTTLGWALLALAAGWTGWLATAQDAVAGDVGPPPRGLCQSCDVVQVIDGDTLEVQITPAYRWRIRVLDCWTPESRGPKRTPAGDRAKAHAAKLIAEAKAAGQPFCVFVPFDFHGHDEPINVLRLVTFDRVLGHVYVGEESFAEKMIAAGHATKNKVAEK